MIARVSPLAKKLCMDATWWMQVQSSEALAGQLEHQELGAVWRDVGYLDQHI